MLVYKKENGFPTDLIFETEEFEIIEEGYKGFKSIVKDKDGKIVKEIYHAKIHDRALWADGYMTALEK